MEQQPSGLMAGLCGKRNTTGIFTINHIKIFVAFVPTCTAKENSVHHVSGDLKSSCVLMKGLL